MERVSLEALLNNAAILLIAAQEAGDASTLRLLGEEWAPAKVHDSARA